MATTIQKTVEIDLAFDCTPPEGSEEIPTDIMVSTLNKINNFLAGEIAKPPDERFVTTTNVLHVRLNIDVIDIDYAKMLETKLINNIGSFPPEIPNVQKFNYFRVPITTEE